MTNLHDSAITYATFGFFVFPLKPRDKTPLTEHGVKDATTDVERIDAWWARWPDANIGIACGPSNLVVVDLDGERGAESWRDLVLEYGLDRQTQTVTCLTARGQHLYFSANGQDIRNSAGKLGPGIDVRGVGGYVVAPPSVHPSGKAYEWEVGYDPWDGAELKPFPEPLARLLAAPKPAETPAAATGGPTGGRIPAGARNVTLTAMAGAMRRRGATQEAIEAALLAENRRRCDPPLDPQEVRRIAASIARYPPAMTAVAEEDRGEADLQKDYGHAAVLATLFQNRYRWAEHRRSWMHYTGQVWRPVSEESVAKQAADALRQYYAEQLAATTDKALVQELARKATETCVYARIVGALSFLRGWENILTEAGDWDKDPWLLNVANGTLDLRTCTLRPHNSADLLTQLAPVAYDPDAPARRWLQHLETFLPDPDVRRQVQRDLGLSLVGADLEELLPIWYGTGGNGKSTTLRVVAAVLGDYAKMAAPRLLLASKYERHPAELADLYGARVVFSVEITGGARLDEERVKALTGGENVKARFMRADFFEFPRTWTIVLVCNHKPDVRGTDNAIWRRIRLVPWTVELPREKQRPQADVVAELLEEAPAILAWMVRGLRDWQSERLWLAKAVQVATQSYREEQDVLAAFLADCCELGPRYSVATGALYDAYVSWCGQNGEDPLGKRAFATLLAARGLQKDRSGHKGGRIWRGVRLLTHADAISI